MSFSNAWPNREQLRLLKASLLDSRKDWEEWSSGVDFEKIDPASFKLLPLLARSKIASAGLILSKSKGIYRRTWMENLLNWDKILPVLGNLQKAGVQQIVLLKGMAMIHSVYRDFGIRVLGDIDILIRREDLPIALEWLSSAGWTHHIPRFSVDSPEHLTRWHALNFTSPEGLRLDLHWSFIQENSKKLDAAVFQSLIPIDPPGLFVPNATDLLLQTCVHGVKYSPVPLIRWVADAFTLIKKKTIDWDRLKALGQIAQVSLPVYHALKYLKKEFDIPTSALLNFQKTATFRLEFLEYQWNLKGYPKIGDWHRFCLNRGYFSLFSRLIHLPHYCKDTARLSSFWQLPFFGLYWVSKRFRRFLRKHLKV